MPDLYTYQTKTPQQVHDDGLRTTRNGLIGIGVTNPNTGPNSDYDKIWTAIGNEIAVGQANGTIMADQLMPDTAAGTYLDRWLALLKLSRLPASGSHGVVTVSLMVPSTLIPTGAQLTDTAGLRYQVSTGGAYANESQVPVQAIDTGSATDHANGDVLTWTNPPPFAAATVTVGTPGATDGLVDGNDSEVGQDEAPRNRLFNVLQNPPTGGNWAQVSSWGAQAAPGVVSLCSVYPALLGPSTTCVAVSAVVNLGPLTSGGSFSANSFSRVVPSALVSAQIVPYIIGKDPEHAYITGLSTADSPCDVALQLDLPSAPTASPAGPGGGWIDAAPWPPSNGSDGVRITGITTSRIITVNATTTTPPVAGGTHVSWVSPDDWEIHDALVLAFTGSSGAWVLTLDTPLPNVVTDTYVFPSSTNQDVYLAALLGAFATMGPGEWTNNVTILQRGFRHPIPTLVAPSAMGATQLSAVIRSSVEVEDAQYIFRTATTPPLPAGPVGSNPPFVFTPGTLGWYPV
jgi:type IV secretory pathway VirB2 component (pilin)